MTTNVKDMPFTGTWVVVESPDFDDEYMRMETKPYVTLRQSGDRVSGEYHIGLQSGDIDGRMQTPNQIAFSFGGMDEMDEVHGRGTAKLEEGRLAFTLHYHMGDTFTFYGVRKSREATRGGR